MILRGIFIAPILDRLGAFTKRF